MMRTVLLVVLCGGVVCAAGYAWQLTGSLEVLYDTTLLPRMRPGVTAGAFTSYARKGGNDDGFSGKNSKLRLENGDSVIAEMAGPGCINRIWFTHSKSEVDGLLGNAGEHIRIYIDGAATPALDVPLYTLFDNSLERFPNPIAGAGIGGFYSYVPIPYTTGCKVVIEGNHVRFYQLNYLSFPSAAGVKPFRMAMTPQERRQLAQAVQCWQDPMRDLMESGAEKIEFAVSHDPENRKDAPHPFTCTLEAPEGKTMLIHGMVLEGLSAAAIQRSDIEIIVEEPGVAPVRVPMRMFFGQALGAIPFNALLFGGESGRIYSRVPIVYSGKCTIRFNGIFPLQGTLALYQAPLAEEGVALGRLAVAYRQQLTAIDDPYYAFLSAAGRGHVVGTFMASEGPKDLPYWLEGDDRWVIDGALRIHGTGSEDYFNCGWYALPGRLNGPEVLPSHGFPVYGESATTMCATAFRCHFSDPVPFQQHIDFRMEHGGYNSHIVEYESAVFYYTRPYSGG